MKGTTMKQGAGGGGEVLVVMPVMVTNFWRRISTMPRRNGVAGGGRLPTQVEYHNDDTYELLIIASAVLHQTSVLPWYPSIAHPAGVAIIENE